MRPKAAEGTRTLDLVLTKDALYQLSYSSAEKYEIEPRNPNVRNQCKRVKGIEPSYSAWKAAALPLSYTRVVENVSMTNAQFVSFIGHFSQWGV